MVTHSFYIKTQLLTIKRKKKKSEILNRRNNSLQTSYFKKKKKITQIIENIYVTDNYNSIQYDTKI